MTYQELKKLFQEHESGTPDTHLTAGITFSSFGPDNHETYSWESRTYIISSNNKAFQPNMGGYSIFGSCLDGTDQCLRLDWRMREESGDSGGWIVKDCFLTGYLLVECSELGISAPKLFYTRNDAVESMLSRLADEGDLDLEQLNADYTSTKELFGDDWYGADSDSAWLAERDEDWRWKIQTIRIYSPLNIVFPDAGGMLFSGGPT